MLEGQLRLTGLNREIVDAFVEEIVVYAKDRVEIKWKVNDEFEPLAVVNKNPDEDIVVVSKSEWDSIQETLRIVQNKELSDKVLRGMAQVRAGETQEHAIKE